MTKSRYIVKYSPLFDTKIEAYIVMCNSFEFEKEKITGLRLFSTIGGKYQYALEYPYSEND